jgi:hypothetical protein
LRLSDLFIRSSARIYGKGERIEGTVNVDPKEKKSKRKEEKSRSGCHGANDGPPNDFPPSTSPFSLWFLFPGPTDLKWIRFQVYGLEEIQLSGVRVWGKEYVDCVRF